MGDAVYGKTDRGIRQLILRIAGELEACRHLIAIPGIGPLIATATIAAIGNGPAFKKGRGFAAWLGVVPGEHSTGKQKLTGTSRRVNKYLSAYRTAVENETIFRSECVAGQSGIRKRKQVATVALENKMARMVWAVLCKGDVYRPPLLVQTVAANGLHMTPGTSARLGNR